MNLIKDINVVRVQNAAAAGTTTLTSSVIDMTGYDGVVYVALLGDVTINSVLTLTAKENTINGTTGTPTSGPAATYTDADGTTADNKMLVVDEYRPQKRYSYCTLARATANAAVDGIIAIQYRSTKKPSTLDASVIASNFAVGS
jgi:hypothetical protein